MTVLQQLLFLLKTIMIIIILLLSIGLVVVEGSIIPYNFELKSNSTFVQYNDGYIRSPGYIDLSNLLFQPIGKTTNDEKEGSSIIAKKTSIIDIAIFPLPKGCSKYNNKKKNFRKETNTGNNDNNNDDKCDWSRLGIGKRRSDTGTMMWCCSADAVKLGICTKDSNNYQRLMIDNNVYRGVHRSIEVPLVTKTTTTNSTGSLSFTDGRINAQKSSTYIVLYANCDNDYNHGTSILISGESIWYSDHGYLPGELYGFMIFYYTVTIIYLILFVSFRYLMNINTSSRIEIEKWIMITITMGLMELIFRSVDYHTWNANGTRSAVTGWIGFMMGVLKQGISRCLLVMVSMGWGVTRDTLGPSMKWIIIFGTAYVVISAINHSIVISADDWLYSIFADGIVGFILLLTATNIIIDIIFIVWVFDSLKRTIQLLIKLNQTQKLARICHLRKVFFCSVLFAMFYTIVSWIEHFHITEGGMLEKQYAWATDAATEINYLFLLIGIAILWRPNKNAKQYVYTMELPSITSSNSVENGGMGHSDRIPLIKEKSKAAD